MKRRHYVLFILGFSAFLVFLGPGMARIQDEGMGINVMSFNIRYDNPRDGENAWPRRQDLVARTITFHRADICGMQEALKHQIEDLERLLPGYGWIGKGRADGESKGEYCPIFYNRERFEVVDSSTFWLSEAPDEPGSRSWDSSLPRIVTWIEFKDLFLERTFFLFNTHFDHRGSEARKNSASLLMREIDKISGAEPAVVTGDFNCSPESPPYNILVSGVDGKPGLRDAFLEAKAPYGGTQTFNGFNDEIRPGSRIDFIFVGPSVTVLRFGIFADRWDGRFVSDHYPVLAEISLK